MLIQQSLEAQRSLRGLLLVLSLMLLCPKSGLSAGSLPQDIFPSEREASLWREIEAPRDEISRKVVNANRSHFPCATSPVAYFRCMNMLLAVLSYHKDTFRLLLPEDQDPSTGSILHFGEIRLHQEAELFEGLAPKTPFSVEQLRERRMGIHRLFYGSRSPGFDFEEFYLWLEANILDDIRYATRRTEITVAALNAWYRATDPYARIQPRQLVEVAVEAPPLADRIDSMGMKVYPDVVDAGVPDLSEKIGYIRFPDFSDYNLPFLIVLGRLKGHRIRGLIIDLRENPGSFLQDMYFVLDNLTDNTPNPALNHGQVLFYTKPWDSDRSDLTTPYYSHKSDLVSGMPIVVIVDHTVKSSAEIFAGALQFLNRAWILGDNTFGKGTRLDQISVFSGEGILSLSANLMYLPNNTTPHIWGITPDFLVDPTGAPRISNVYEYLQTTFQAPIVDPRFAEKRAINSCRTKNTDAETNRKRQFGISSDDLKVQEAFLVLQCILQK